MKIALPVADGKLCVHFGHCQQFWLFTVDCEKKEILDTDQLNPPPHQPGLFPRWLNEQGANTIIAGGMGMRAQNLFQENDIRVVVGAPPDEAAAVVQAYLDGELVTGGNLCDH